MTCKVIIDQDVVFYKDLYWGWKVNKVKNSVVVIEIKVQQLKAIHMYSSLVKTWYLELKLHQRLRELTLLELKRSLVVHS